MVGALLEAGLSALLPGQPHPTVLLLLALSVGMSRRVEEGAALAFVGGVLSDALGGLALGRTALALVVATVVVFVRYTELARRTVLAPLVAAAVGTLLYWLVLVLVDATNGMAVPWLHVLVRWALPTLLVNVLLIWPVLYGVTRLRAARGLRLIARQ
ncbi:MAG: rod shape-determining protein MreD [Chloroflexota bacterium]|nr:rod shape-determining protein MreD [Chloroflexota bacterium]